MFEPDDAREMERAFKVLGDRMEDGITADCSEVGCPECDDPNCGCDCHSNQERFDLPEYDIPSFESTGIPRHK